MTLLIDIIPEDGIVGVIVVIILYIQSILHISYSQATTRMDQQARIEFLHFEQQLEQKKAAGPLEADELDIVEYTAALKI